MKKIVILGICSMLLLASCGGEGELIVDESEVIDEAEEVVELDEGESKPLIEVLPTDTVRILVRADGYPGMWADEDGNVFGFYVDLERMVMERMNQPYEFVPYIDVGVGAQALKTGTSHSALAVPDVPDFRAFLRLSIPYERLHYITFVQEGDNSITAVDKAGIIKSLYGKRVGVQTQGHIWQVLREYKDIELVDYPTTTKAMEALNMGEVDAVPENRETAAYYAEQNGWKVKSVGEYIHFYFNTTGYSRVYTPSIVEKHNDALQSLLDDGSVRSLHEKYYGDIAYEYSVK